MLPMVGEPDITVSEPTPNREPSSEGQIGITRIAVGVDGYSEGRDAVALAAAISALTGAELMLVTVHVDPLVPMPAGLSWSSLHGEAEKMLREVRASLAPNARIRAETDLSVPRALHRVVGQHHRNLLVVGSSRDAAEGRVRIGKRTRQLLCHFECALAIAPRGLHSRPDVPLRTIGVGYDGSPEAGAALALAATLAAGARAELRVHGVVDDRVPVLLRSALGGLIATEWHDVMGEEEQRLRDMALAETGPIDAPVTVEVSRGRPADALLALAESVDLLVVGSRRWGPTARVLMGSTGEALLHDAACPVLAVPRPAGSPG